MLIKRDDITGLGIELNHHVTVDVIDQGIQAFRRNTKYIDWTTGWYTQTTPTEMIVAMSACDGFLSGCGLKDYSENKYRLFGWLECWFATQGIAPRDVKFNHYCELGVWRRDREYRHLATGVTAQFHQTVTQMGAWSSEQHADVRPWIQIQNWHGDTKLNQFIALAQEYACLLDPYEYVRYVNEQRNRHLFSGEINSVFRHLGRDQCEQLEVWAILKHGPVSATTWHQAQKAVE